MKLTTLLLGATLCTASTACEKAKPGVKAPPKAAAPAPVAAPAPPEPPNAESPVEPDPVDVYERLLQSYARDGGFDYAGLAKHAEDREALRRVAESLAGLPEDAPLAAWLDAYNALVIQSVMARYPLESVMKVDGFFKKQTHRVAGEDRTLDQIEHGIIRERFPDARVHFALNCGARSCPALHDRAFQRVDLDATLDRLTRQALSNPRHLKRDGRRLALTALFFWFEEDFVRDGGGSVLGFLREHAPAGALEGVDEKTRLVQMEYDWALNQAPAAE